MKSQLFDNVQKSSKESGELDKLEGVIGKHESAAAEHAHVPRKRTGTLWEYHYFDGKDALLSTLSDLFDQKYLALQEAMDPAMPAMDKLLFLNRALFRMIENSVSMDLLARLLSTQLVTNGERQMTKTIIPGVKDGLKALGRTDEPPVLLRAHEMSLPSLCLSAPVWFGWQRAY